MPTRDNVLTAGTLREEARAILEKAESARDQSLAARNQAAHMMSQAQQLIDQGREEKAAGKIILEKGMDYVKTAEEFSK